jgi:hypothetical protein
MFLVLTKRIAIIGFVAVLHLTGSLPVQADVLVSVSGQSGPWEWNGGLNTNYQYNQAALDQLPPTVVAVNNLAGISLIPGDALTITYDSGFWYGGSGYGPFDASGAATYLRNTQADCWNGPNATPGYYLPTSDFPLRWMSLLGVFTDSAGGIINSLFVIGDANTVIVPQGAIKLELGAEDAIYGDNSGAVTMRIKETPEPSALVLLIVGAFGLLAHARRRRKGATCAEF